jgi:small-conductance mechanosensitive channel
MEQIAAWFNGHNVSLGTVVITIVVLIAASVFIFVLNRLLRVWFKGVESRHQLPYETILTITRVILGAVWVITAMLILDVWGVGLRGLWGLLISGAAVIGVGFLATWAIVSNFTASFFITFWRPFRLGDTIELLPENLKGRVIDRNLMFTILREGDDSVLQVPNNLFFQKAFRVSGSSEQSFFELLESKSRVSPIKTGSLKEEGKGRD